VAIAGADLDTRSIDGRDALSQGVDVFGLNIAEEESVKRGPDAQGAKRRAFELSPCPAVYPETWSSKKVEIHELRPQASSSLRCHRRHECRGVPLNVGEFFLRPRPTRSCRQSVPSPPYHTGVSCRRSGISSQTLRSRTRPADFGVRPPHCLKKNGTPALRHWSRMSRAHSAAIERRPGPLSPPTMTQWIPASGKLGIGPSSGSIERKRTAAGTVLRSSMRVV
jgi:hypothetical protein